MSSSLRILGDFCGLGNARLEIKSKLRILHLEDDPRDTELVQETLAMDGISSHVTRVETEADFVASLQQGGFDLILADYTLASFDGLSALKIARENLPHRLWNLGRRSGD